MERSQTAQPHTLYLIKEAVKLLFYENDANADNKQQNQAQELPEMQWETTISSLHFSFYWSRTSPQIYDVPRWESNSLSNCQAIRKILGKWCALERI